MNKRVLLLDDNTNILRGFCRHLRGDFDVTVAERGHDALEYLREEEPFAAIVSDMNMPEMDGIEFLKEAQKVSPDTVRIMLTGNADQQTTLDAIRDGRIFHFLSKPCPVDTLRTVLYSAVEQYRRLTAEKELLEETLTGSVRAMTELLSLARPVAFARASRIQRLVRKLASLVQLPNSWELETAAMLSQAGSATVPDNVLQKATSGNPLSSAEINLLRGLGWVAADLIARIPRMENVAQMIAVCYPAPEPCVTEETEPLPDDTSIEVRVLQLALDYDTLINLGQKPSLAIEHLRQFGRVRDESLLSALEQATATEQPSQEVQLDGLQVGQILAEDVTTPDGSVTLIGKGHELTERLLLRLHNLRRDQGIREPLHVVGEATAQSLAVATF